MLILHNARINTLDENHSHAEAVAIDGNTIKFVGSNEQILASSSRNDKVIDLGGKCILPGLIDSHLHLDAYALSLEQIHCETDSMDECIKRVTDKARLTTPGQWITGHGWNQNIWGGNLVIVANLIPQHLETRST